MFITGTTPVRVNGRITRVLSRHFNAAFKATGGNPIVLDRDGGRIVPGKGWGHVSEAIRLGKKVQAKVEGK